MFRNYFKIALRNLKKDTFFSFLNILGLGLGIAVSILIVQYLRGEWYVDRHNNDFEDIYQVNTAFDFGKGKDIYAMAPSPLANKLLVDYPEVINATRLILPPGVNKYLLKNGDISIFESKGIYADSTFFSMFKYPFVEGSAKRALKRPNDIVISESLANKLFKGKTALGKTIEINTQWGDEICNISGVIKTNVYRSHLNVELFVNMNTGSIGNRFANLDEWAGNNVYFTYLKFNPKTNIASFEKKFPALVESTAGERLRNLGFSKSHSLIPLKDIYLKSVAKNNQGKLGDITFFYIFAAIGFFILVIACINFMNLSTAKSSLRAKEVAVKKVLGANKSTLAFQFFTETILYTFFGLIVAILFIYIGQKYLLEQIGLQLKSFSWHDWQIGIWGLIILSLTSFLAGSYPALMLSSFKPSYIFNGKLGNNFSAAQVRKVLVIVQFVISIMLIQGILVVKEQMNFIKSEDLGYSKTEKIILPLNTKNASKNAQNLKNLISNIPTVTNVGIGSSHPGIRNMEDMLVYGEDKSKEENIYVELNFADADYISTMGFELLSGRNLMQSDSTSAIVTESALAGLGYTIENAINKEVKWNWNTEVSRRIVGVIKDYHSKSLKELIVPQIFLLNEEYTQSYLVASVNTSNLSHTISGFKQTWNTINNTEPFEFYFLNDKVQNAYEADEHMSSLITIFTILAILISCLGLIGLSAFAADRRKKEIGIRKVLGASIGSVIKLLSVEFLWLVIIALIIATPIAWYFTNAWLETFPYSIHMPVQVYIKAGILAIIICIITVSYQAIKAAITNPTSSLKTE